MALPDNALERTGLRCGRRALALNGVLAGLESAPCISYTSFSGVLN